MASKLVAVQTIQLPQAALTAGSHNRSSNAPRSRYTEPTRSVLRLHHEQDQVPAGLPDTLPVNPLKIGSSFEPDRCRKIELPFRRQSVCDPCAGGPGGPCGRFCFACAPENHGSSYAFCCWAETFFSSSVSLSKSRAGNDIAGAWRCQASINTCYASLLRWIAGSTCNPT